MDKSLFYKIIIILMLSSYFLTKFKTFLAKSVSSSWCKKLTNVVTFLYFNNICTYTKCPVKYSGASIPERWKFMSIYKCAQNIHSSFTVIVNKWKPKYPSTDEQINKRVCSYCGIPLNNKNWNMQQFRWLSR